MNNKLLLGGVIIVALLFYLFLNASNKNVELQAKYAFAQEVIANQTEMFQKISEASKKREEQFAEQDKKLYSIQRELRTLKTTNKQLAELLNTVIPTVLLDGLRSFKPDSRSSNGTGSSIPASGNSDKPK